MANSTRQIADNVERIRERIAAAAARSGRQSSDVTLVAVAKYVDVATTRTLVECGCRVLGESRPQQLWEKATALSDLDPSWHLIGHLQRNKVKRTVPVVSLVESGDSVRLLDELNREVGERAIRLPVLLDFNVSGDVSKHGFDTGELERLADRLMSWPHLEFRGLMAMGGRTSDDHAVRAQFARVREVRDRLQDRVPSGIRLDDLSMGMSGDFEIAIEEGSTIVRVGSALFAGCD